MAQTDNRDNSDILLKTIQEQSNLKVNDLVIHLEYGLGKFLGIYTLKIDEIENDFIKIEYRDNTSLFVPVETFDLISRYSDYDETVVLDRLGSNSNWSAKKKKIREDLKKIAKDLIDLATKRALAKTQIFTANSGEYEEFCNAFPFQLTIDQAKAVDDIANDLAKGKPMDRLLCGDVGYGKTEVAIRASFIVAKSVNKAQVAVIVPTTLLCKQHYSKFMERFKNTGLNIKSLSRFSTNQEKKYVYENLSNGNIDIIIGTHTLLGKNIKFHNLGLLIIDEEQLFGVVQKEKLKSLKANCHILSMSATPIPRTLQMSLANIRDLSLIMTPPVNRLNVENHSIVYDDNVIKDAIQKELRRNGRVFFVVPRITDIDEVKARLKLSMPNLKFNFIHGQMDNDEIDEIMSDFYDGKFKVLISTTIIESGIDIPMANTVIIYRANNFGLAQLYQLRGRVGRSNIQAYMYLTVKESEAISDLSKQRLEIIEKIDSLNAGFTISSADMELRGTGNILGEQQSGHIKEIGIELYNEMLRNAIKKAESKNTDDNKEDDFDDFSPEVKLSISTIIPASYIKDSSVKMKFYRKIANIRSEDDKFSIQQQLYDGYGALPESVENLLRVSLIRIKCKQLNIKKLEKLGNSIVISFNKNQFSNPDKLIQLSFDKSGKYKIKKDRFIYENEIKGDIFEYVNEFLGKIG